MTTRAHSRISAGFLALMIAFGFALAAPAAQAVDDTEVLDSFDLSRTFSISSNTPTVLQYIPIPAGLTPYEISGTVFPEAAVAGRVVFLKNNRTIASFPVTPDTEALEVTFPVDASQIDENGFLVFGMRFLTENITDEELICVISDFGTVSFEEVVVRVSGREAPPSTIAQFFSNSVRKIAIMIPEDPSVELQEAGLQAATALAARYQSRETDISLTTEDNDARRVDVDAIGGRLVRIIPGEGEVVARVGLNKGMRELTLTGDPAKLTVAAAALGSPKLMLVDASETSELTFERIDVSIPQLTLAELGAGNISLGGIGTSVQQIFIDQSQFGAPVKSFSIHLEGVRSQVPAQVSAMLSIYWNGDLLSSEVFDANTTIELDLEVAETRVRRNNSLSFRMDAIPNGGGGSGTTNFSSNGLDCGGVFGVLPIEVFIDGEASSILATPGQSLKPGFMRMPQVFGGVVPVAISGTSLLSDSVTDAAELLIALQRAASSQMTVRLMDPEAFMASSSSGIIVGASTEEIARLGAPLRMAEFRQIESVDAVFAAGVRDSYAALQAFSSGGREILSLSSWGPHQPGATVGRLLQSQIVNYVTTSEFGWQGLFDDLLIAQMTTKEPTFLNSESLVPQVERLSDNDSVLLWVGAGLASLILFAGLGWLSRRHLRRRARKYVRAQERRRKDSSTSGPTRRSDDDSSLVALAPAPPVIGND
jgi:hypothetical protein